MTTATKTAIGQEPSTSVAVTEPSNDANTTDDEEKQQGGGYTKLIIGLLFLGFIAYVIVDSFTTQHIRGAVQAFLEWFENNIVIGAFLFIAVYAICTVLFIPGSILTLGAGFVFASALGSLGLGVLIGAIVVITGAWIGGILAFLVGRYLLRESMSRLAEKYKLFQAIDNALKVEGLKIFLLLRLSPIAPFNVTNYLGGVSAVSFRDYAISLLGIAPGTFLYVFFGASAGSLVDGESGGNRTVTIIIAVVGSVLGIAAIWVTTRFARKELNRIVEEEQKEQANDDDNVDVERPAVDESDQA